MIERIGFACKYMHPDRTLSKKELEVKERYYNTRAITLKWLNSVSVAEAEEKLFFVIEHNLEAQKHILAYINSLPDSLKMMRISSDLLPLYSHPSYAYFYKTPLVKNYIEEQFAYIGNYVRENNIKVSFHPGQFCVLASESSNVVENSIKEFEYHADMIRMMGFGQRFQDFKCNVHISGKLGVEGILAVLPRLSTEARNTITFENEEKKYGLDDCLLLANHAPIVLDVHHHWVREGSYINRDDSRVERVLESWRGVRPTMHYSQSQEILIDAGISPYHKIDTTEVLNHFNKKDLYAHSNMMWNDWCNRYVLEFLPSFDIMFEVKYKNVALLDFYENYLKK